jgi:hypothetical protein
MSKRQRTGVNIMVRLSENIFANFPKILDLSK